MKNKFVIRKVAFHYSDDHHYFHAIGAIEGNIFTDYQEAHNALITLERQAYLVTDLGDIEPFSGCSSDVNMDKMIRLKYYFEKELGLNILKTDDYGRISSNRDTFLTKDITNEQIDRIRNLSGLKFYELVEFIDEPQFFGIWKKSPFYRKEGFRETSGSIYFYNTYLEAYNAATENCPYDLNETKIKGKLEEISDMPIILKTLIKTSHSISYDEFSEELTIRNMMNTDWVSLCTLLKNKPFEIRLLTFDDVKDCEQGAYECM